MVLLFVVVFLLLTTLQVARQGSKGLLPRWPEGTVTCWLACPNMESQSDSDDSLGNDDTGVKTQEPRSSLIEEYSTEQQQLEAATAETHELKQQLDEAGRMGLELYEANAKLKEEAEEMEATS